MSIMKKSNQTTLPLSDGHAHYTDQNGVLRSVDTLGYYTNPVTHQGAASHTHTILPPPELQKPTWAQCSSYLKELLEDELRYRRDEVEYHLFLLEVKRWLEWVEYPAAGEPFDVEGYGVEV
jgi:hypothetical protein